MKNFFFQQCLYIANNIFSKITKDLKMSKRKVIKIPNEMPLSFRFKNREYRIYKNLKRSKKLYIISIYKKHKSEIIPISREKEDLKLIKKPKIFGLIIFMFDERAGPLILGKIPDNFEIKSNILMQIYMNHQASKESKIQSMNYDDREIISFYSGEEEIYIIIFSEKIENPEIFESNFELIYKDIIQQEDKEFYVKREIGNMFKQLVKY